MLWVRPCCCGRGQHACSIGALSEDGDNSGHASPQLVFCQAFDLKPERVIQGLASFLLLNAFYV